MAEALMELYEMISPEAQRELFDFALPLFGVETGFPHEGFCCLEKQN